MEDPVEKALLIDEVLELILVYAASMEKWKSSSNLRRVSKRWRSLSFKGLSQSIWLPKLCIQDSKDFYYSRFYGPNVSLPTFKKLFPRTCPEQMTLSKPKLPFELVIRRLPTTDEFSFIQEMASQIAAVEVSHESEGTWDVLKEQNINSQLISNAQFPNLRKLQVNWENATEDSLFKEFVQNLIATTSKRLIWVKYQYPMCENTENWPAPPSNLTSICYYGDGGGVLDLQKLLIGTVDKLNDLFYMIYKKEDPSVLEFTLEDCRTLSGIVQHYNKTLRSLCIRPIVFTEVTIRGAIELDQMNSLRILESAVPLHFKKLGNNPVERLNLTNLEYKIQRCPGTVFGAWEAIRIYSSTLEVLGLDWSRESLYYNSDDNFAANQVCEEAFLEELQKGLPVCSRLRNLGVSIPFRVGLPLTPRIYESMKNLTSLRLFFDTEAGKARPTPQGNRDLFKMLTGCVRKDVPKDELLWPKFLIERNTCSIASLKDLKSLYITAPGRLNEVLGRFIFWAGFMQMSKLHKIEVHCGIMVDTEMKREWNHRGGVINTDMLVYGCSDSPRFSSDDESASSDA